MLNRVFDAAQNGMVASDIVISLDKHLQGSDFDNRAITALESGQAMLRAHQSSVLGKPMPLSILQAAQTLDSRYPLDVMDRLSASIDNLLLGYQVLPADVQMVMHFFSLVSSYELARANMAM